MDFSSVSVSEVNLCLCSQSIDVLVVFEAFVVGDFGV